MKDYRRQHLDRLPHFGNTWLKYMFYRKKLWLAEIPSHKKFGIVIALFYYTVLPNSRCELLIKCPSHIFNAAQAAMTT